MKLTCHLCGKDIPFPAPVEVDTMNFDGLSDIEKAVYAHINLPKACPAHEPICVACGKQFQEVWALRKKEVVSGEYVVPPCPVCAYDPVDEKRDLEDWSSVYLMATHFLHQYSMQDPAHLTYFLLR